MTLPNFAVETEAEISACLPQSVEAPDFSAMLRYPFGWVDTQLKPVAAPAGKGIRPTICLLACQASGAYYRRALPAAAAVEIIHNFSLVHDDIQDRSPARRHRPSVWALWGEAQAINVGDAMFVAGRRALGRLATQGVPAAVILQAIEALDAACMALCEGQYLDMDFESRAVVTEAEYYAMVSRKTGALLGCSAQLGALIATGDARIAELYRHFGQAVGVAFQVQDDILGIWGNTAVTGKPVADDLIARKKTLPVLFARRWATGVQNNERDARCILEYYKPDAPASLPVEPVAEAMARCGARVYAEEVAREWHDRAMQTLAQAAPAESAGRALRELSEGLLGRQT
jgi:geranylgeranyl diphosphate synthase type I